jgi:hypothetical protein
MNANKKLILVIGKVKDAGTQKGVLSVNQFTSVNQVTRKLNIMNV